MDASRKSEDTFPFDPAGFRGARLLAFGELQLAPGEALAPDPCVLSRHVAESICVVARTPLPVLQRGAATCSVNLNCSGTRF
jgi:hypothetical protein